MQLVSATPRLDRVPYAGLTFDRREVESAFGALVDSFVSGWFALGKYGAIFEAMLSKYLGVKDSVLTNSGSSANLLAVAAMIHVKRLSPGDEVLTPAVTFPTTVNPLLLYGLKPVLVDVELPSYTISVDKLKCNASEGTRGVMLPHLNGSASQMSEIAEFCRKRDWVLIEDCCDAIGTEVAGKPVGTFGDVASFSFYAAHHIGMGEGGAIVSTNQEYANIARSIRDWGRALGKETFNMRKGRKMRTVGSRQSLPKDYETRYTYISKGFNLKPIDIQAAMGLAQLAKLDAFKAARKKNFQRLFAHLSRYSSSLILPQALPNVDVNWFVFPMIVRRDAPFERRAIVEHLEKKSIETRPILAGNILKQPAYAPGDFIVRENLINSNLVLKNGFFVGVYPGLGDEQLRVIESGFDTFFQGRFLS